MKTVKIIYHNNDERDLLIRDYFYFDWARNYTTMKSTSDFIIMLNRKPVS